MARGCVPGTTGTMIFCLADSLVEADRTTCACLSLCIDCQPDSRVNSSLQAQSWSTLLHGSMPMVSVTSCSFRGAGIALDIAKGLHFLHSHHVMHLDLKSPNILLALDGTAKIADVGMSRMFTTRSLPVAKVSDFFLSFNG